MKTLFIFSWSFIDIPHIDFRKFDSRNYLEEKKKKIELV